MVGLHGPPERVQGARQGRSSRTEFTAHGVQRPPAASERLEERLQLGGVPAVPLSMSAVTARAHATMMLCLYAMAVGEAGGAVREVDSVVALVDAVNDTEVDTIVLLERYFSLESTVRQPDPDLSEFRADSLGVKCCSHTLLLHAWVSVRRARSHPERMTLIVIAVSTSYVQL